ncbi:F0F1 ATP synthase subunit A [Leekyejoonella antrihumi]|uniref:ATP synthase subunit a n=1 Tax=Leekyejoonella antrihumi TaxID=1660198 RepID=A0A563E2T2_9MICO|nr:F0F1 ATP synthase subunit A [Leekyejoonella antrihumi]TWP36511.1 F0F1 ATP synthase subunit A [Leekyejoonella antrihumi]
MSPALASTIDINVGQHIQRQFLGMTFNLDTIWSTVIAGLIVVGLGLWMRSKITSGVPSKLQIMWESIVDTVTKQVEDSLGTINPFVVPLAIALFTFILVANWIEMVPTMDKVPSPSADVNLTYAMALFVIVCVHVYSIRQRRLGGYIKHYFQPYPALALFNLIEEIAKPFSLALRLFGNIFAGGIMLSLIALFPSYILWGPEIVWKLFDMFIGLIQAFIFALLTILYFGMAGSHDEEHEQEGAAKAKADAAEEKIGESVPELQGAH